MTHPNDKFEQILKNRVTEEEAAEFLEWLGDPKNKDEFEKYKKLYHSTSGYHPSAVQTEKALSKLSSHINRDMERRRQRKLWKYSAAACILLVLGSQLLLRNYESTVDNSGVRNLSTREPGKIYIVQEDGDELDLMNIDGSTLVKLKGVALDVEERTIDYSIEDNTPVYYSTLHVPGGEKFRVALSDGTVVWLNSESSLHYPNRFEGDNRKVTVTGEAYFEVAKNDQKPFIVTSDQMRIEVLGTTFNINDYKDNGRTFMTLVSGSVRVDSREKSVIAKPNEQIILKQDDPSLYRRTVNPSAYTAWKDDILVLEDEYFDDFIRKLKRWYGVEIQVELRFPPSGRFNGEFDRKELDIVMKTLALNLNAEYSIINGTVYFTQK